MPRHAQHNRQETLDKALSLFWRKGFKATSLKDLEDALDMRPGSIYASFGSKEKLFQEVLQRYGRQGLVELERILTANSSPLGGLADYLRQLGELRDTPRPSHACMLVKTLLELGPGGQSALAQEILDSMETRFIDAFKAAREVGELAPGQDPERLGHRFQAQVMGLRAYAERKIERAALHALADDMADDVERLARV
ncbi:TetR/AcrR family transcriptional regulator [Halomonas sp. M20]|uniref:TetR/AcrR family transcriptional regulator n=1 Tax=Halomonas sp. M20 TaxID=2763264 RepID=UPI001D09D2BC|nr:TetR/AcrR family transcriptional regulator [Halomonas sp. M20]